MTEAPRGHRLLQRLATSTPVVHVEPRVIAESVMPARFKATVQLSECSSLLGPVISLQASLELPGLQARLTFRDRPRRDDEEAREFSVMVPLVLPGEKLERPMQTLRAAPTRPRFTIALSDCKRQPLMPAQDVGCADGSSRIEVPILVEVGAVVWLSTHATPATSGPRVRVNGKLVFSRGVTAQLGQSRAGEASKQDSVVTELNVISPGAMFFFYERTVDCGLPGEPWVSLTFLDERSQPIGEAQPVGLFHAA